MWGAEIMAAAWSDAMHALASTGPRLVGRGNFGEEVDFPLTP